MMNLEITGIPAAFDRYADPLEVLQAYHSAHLPHYPSTDNRWHVPGEEWDEMAANGVITVPEGHWVVSAHPSREQAAARGAALDPADPDKISPVQKAKWRAEHRLVTNHGLPVHPKARLGVTTEIRDAGGAMRKLGMATGIGRERTYGALMIGNIGLGRLSAAGELEYSVVTTIRQGGKKVRRSFPGGYANAKESIADTCVREGNEEAGLVDACEAAGLPWEEVENLPAKLWSLSPSVTGPCTLNAWLAEHFLMIDATEVPDMQAVSPQTNDADEVKRVEWRPALQLVTDPTFMGAHRRALLAHMALLDS